MSFDFFGIDVLAIAENDDFFFSSGEEQVAVAVNARCGRQCEGPEQLVAATGDHVDVTGSH